VLTVRAPLSVALFVSAFVTVLLTSFGPASAGGPTSALLSVPGQGSTASLYYTDPEYDALADLVGQGTSTATVDQSGVDHANGPGVTVTWLIHDVTPWRVDHIYLEGKGAPWIATQVMVGETGTIWDSPVVWHQPESGGKLEALLARLGVAEAARGAGEFDGVAGAPLPPPAGSASEEPGPTTSAESTRASTLDGVWWALGGLLLGVLLTLIWMRARATVAPEAQAVPDDEPSGPEHAVKEELAWPVPRA
jgi:hypothetical protein